MVRMTETAGNHSKENKMIKDWQKPILDLIPGKATSKAITYKDLKITKYHDLYQIKLGNKNVSVKDQFIFLPVNRLTLTLEETLQAIKEYEQSDGIESFELQ